MVAINTEWRLCKVNKLCINPYMLWNKRISILFRVCQDLKVQSHFSNLWITECPYPQTCNVPNSARGPAYSRIIPTARKTRTYSYKASSGWILEKISSLIQNGQAREEAAQDSAGVPSPGRVQTMSRDGTSWHGLVGMGWTWSFWTSFPTSVILWF